MNQLVMLTGRMGRDPEMQYTPSGVPYTKFSLAVDESWTNRDSGERNKKTIWFNVTVWRRQAEIVAKYKVKGDPLQLQGRMEEPWAYVDKNGQARASLEFTADRVILLPGGKNSGNGNGAGYTPAPDPTDEDIPF